MNDHNPRIERERRTVNAMISLYCQQQHGTRHGLCEKCTALGDYAQQRLLKCPFQESKTTCAKCPVHCYRPDERQEIRSVMRHSGPRMLYRHPVMAIQHMLDGLRQEPTRPLGGE
jgi:hypothetical protein